MICTSIDRQSPLFSCQSFNAFRECYYSLLAEVGWNIVDSYMPRSLLALSSPTSFDNCL